MSDLNNYRFKRNGRVLMCIGRESRAFVYKLISVGLVDGPSRLLITTRRRTYIGPTRPKPSNLRLFDAPLEILQCRRNEVELSLLHNVMSWSTLLLKKNVTRCQ